MIHVRHVVGVLYLLCRIHLSINFPLTCPSKPHWNFRAKSFCENPDDYRCLWDVNYHTFLESCGGFDDQRKGSRKVIEGGITAGGCTPNKYQPRIWTTKGNFDCEFEKSLCNDIGQVVYDDGDGVTDRSCGCDYNAGYAFLQQPTNLCYCIPSVEDCTCVKKICPKDHVVDPEYQCRSIFRWKSSFSCPEIVPCGLTEHPCPEDLTGSKTFSPDVLTNDKTPEKTFYNKSKAIIAIVAVLILIIGMGLGVLLYKDSLFTKQLVATIVYEGETARFLCEVIDENIEVIWSVNDETITDEDRFEMRSNGCIRELLMYNAQADENDVKITAMVHNEISTATLVVREQFKKRSDQWIKDDEMFVPTQAAKEVLNKIQYSNFLVVTGNSGTGKTYTVRHTALMMEKDGYNIVPAVRPNDIIKYFKRDSKTVFVFDDLCGRFTFNQNYLDQWLSINELLQTHLKYDCCKVLASCRLQVYKDKRMISFIHDFGGSECKIVLSTDEKKAMIMKYFGNNDLAITVDELSECDFLPFLCSNFKNISKLEKCFENPFNFFGNYLENLYQENNDGKKKCCALILCVLYNNTLTLDELNKEPEVLHAVLKELSLPEASTGIQG